MAQKRRENPKSEVNGKTKALDPRELRIPDSVIDQILKAMKIPEWRDDAAFEVYSAVQSCVQGFTEGRLGVNKSRYTMIASTCNRLLRELSRPNLSEPPPFL